MWGLFCKPLKVIRIPGSLLKKPGFDSMEKIRDPDFFKIMTFHFTVGFPVKLPGGWDSTLSAATAVLGSLRGAQQWRSARHSWQEMQVPVGILWEDFWENLGLKFLGVVAIILQIALTIGGSYTSSVSKGVRIRRFCGFVFFFGRPSGRGVVCCVITWESVGQRGQLDRFFCQSKAFLATRSQSFQQNHS